MHLSFVIPVYNEEESLRQLTAGILEHSRKHRVEILFVDDGSTDGSLGVIRELAKKHTQVRYIAFRRNFGKSAALDAGFREVTGEVVFTMDADLQDDPAEIPAFLERLAQGADMVSGWKKKRHDPITKTLPSKVFNYMIRRMSGINLHDFNCGFKAYRREVVAELRVYGEMHRFLPVLAGSRGFSVVEIPVQHHARAYGRSKFGIERIMRGFFDMFTVFFLTGYLARPMHLFGGIGIVSTLLGTLTLFYLYGAKLITGEPIGPRPLLFITFFLMGIGIQVLLFGLIAELVIHIRKWDLPDYSIREQSGSDKRRGK
ncbi:MAG: glycosyltransferase family 2 protein [Deltaproteobacteria bacterium]|nr:glycosyltransferase family 2 protein [Deltaproteobacteria bacterium]